MDEEEPNANLDMVAAEAFDNKNEYYKGVRYMKLSQFALIQAANHHLVINVFIDNVLLWLTEYLN